jgi:hypothetical protein
VILLICRANAAEVGPNMKTPGAETGRLEINSLSMLCFSQVLKPPYSQAKKMSNPIYGCQDSQFLVEKHVSFIRRLVKKKELETL